LTALGSPARALIPRFSRSERGAHWLLAATFASMLGTGVVMGGIGPLDHRAVLIVHVGSAVLLLAGIAFLLALRRTRPPLTRVAHDLRAIDERDRRWLRRAPLAYLTGRELPRAGRFNGGQKVNAKLVLLLLTVLFVSGAADLGRHTSLLHPVAFLAAPHGLAAGVAGALVAMHIYLAVLHPATRASLRGITLGSVDREWAEHHHGDWVAAVDERDRREGAAR
jgi:formate dehydrogenase subunit gamma